MNKWKLAIPALLIMLCGKAQDVEETTADADLPVTDGPWYSSPLVWVVGAALCILLLVMLTRNQQRRSD